MMMTLFRLLFLTFFIASCATTRTETPQELKDNSQLSQAQIKQMNEEAVERVSQKLKELSVAAKAAGSDKVRFLASDMFLKASAALMEGDYQSANILLESFLDLVPEDEFVKRKYAISLIKTGQIEKSEAVLSSLYNHSKKKDEQIGLVLAGVQASLGKLKESRAVYAELLKRNPKNEEACIFLGKSYALEKKTQKAVSLLKGCEKQDPKKGIYSYYIGKIFVDKKHFKTAKIYFERSIKREPTFTQGVMALGLIYEELGLHKKARTTYKKYLKSNPEDVMILGRLVQLMFAHEEFNEVIPYAQKLTALEPDNLNLKVKLGILYTDVKDYAKAVDIFKELLSFAPDNDKMLYYLGAIYQETDELEKAVSVFSRIEVKSGLYQDSSLQIANMLSKLAQREFNQDDSVSETEKKFITFVDDKIKTMTKFKVDFSVIKATYFEVTLRRNKAITALKDVEAQKEFTSEHQFYLASLYEKEKEHDESIAIVEKLIKDDPKNAHAWNFLGYSFVERGVELDLAYEYIQKAIALAPKDGYIRDSLGWYYFKTGNTAKALTELKKAVVLVPHDVSVNKHLAIIYIQMKELKLAKRYVLSAINHADEEVEKTELTKVLKDLEANRVPASFN